MIWRTTILAVLLIASKCLMALPITAGAVELSDAGCSEYDAIPWNAHLSGSLAGPWGSMSVYGEAYHYDSCVFGEGTWTGSITKSFENWGGAEGRGGGIDYDCGWGDSDCMWELAFQFSVPIPNTERLGVGDWIEVMFPFTASAYFGDFSNPEHLRYSSMYGQGTGRMWFQNGARDYPSGIVSLGWARFEFVAVPEATTGTLTMLGVAGLVAASFRRRFAAGSGQARPDKTT